MFSSLLDRLGKDFFNMFNKEIFVLGRLGKEVRQDESGNVIRKGNRFSDAGLDFVYIVHHCQAVKYILLPL